MVAAEPDDDQQRLDGCVTVGGISIRTLCYWDVCYLLVTGAAIAAVAFQDGASSGEKLGAALLLTAMYAWYRMVGHRTLQACTDSVPWRRWSTWLVGTLVLFGCAVTLVGSASWATPAVVSQTFWLVPLWPASAAAVAVCFAPVIRELVAGETATEVLRELGTSAVVFSVMSVVIGVVITKIFEHNDEQARLIASLEASRAEVARLSHEAGMSAERDRLAREIHDTLAQGFTSIVTLTQAAESELDTHPELARRHLELATVTARENLAEARALVAALTPTALGTGSLEAALHRHADRFAEETGIRTACHTDDMLPALGTPATVVLLRAAQEALANVRKHARASAVSVRLTASETSVLLTVSDNGTGFDPATCGRLGGFGLPGMRSRVEEVGGCLRISSAPGAGATVELEVPA